MDMPPSGWYPDPYGVAGLLRWWDGSTWTQHTHAGSAHEPTDAAGPATSLDATRVGGPLGASSDEAVRTAANRTVPQPIAGQPTTVQPTTVQPTAVQPTAPQPAALAPTTVQPPVPGVRPGPALDRTQVQASVADSGTRQPGMGSSWPGAGGYRGAEAPYGGGQADQFGTQILPPVTDADWDRPTGGYHALASLRQRRLLFFGLLAAGTVVVLALIGVLISNLGSPGASAPTAETSAAPPVTSAPSPTAQATTATPTQTPSATGTAGGLSDSVSGLSYALLSSPWTSGCPAGLSSPQTLTWTAGESAQAGQFSNNGNPTTWYGEACSAPLPQSYGYTGVADLEPTAMNLMNQFDGPYYGALNHQRTQLASTPTSISGHPAWEIKYLETYPSAASMGLPFNSEEGAIVVADQGTGLPPAVFFVSVPSNLGVGNVDALVSSLTLTVASPSQSATPSASTAQPGGNGQPGGGGGNNP